MGRDYTHMARLGLWITLLATSWVTGDASPDPASPSGGGSPTPQQNPVIIEGPQDEFFARGDPARLNCKVSGDPKPNITWYQNGQLMDPNPNDKIHHRMVMSNGELFFLRVIHTKENRPDVGTYFCKATNVHGSAYSRNATVRIAVIRDDFRQEPVDTTKPAGSTAVLHCRPPRGEPDVDVTWLFNNNPIAPDDRIKVLDDDDLVISMVTKQDSGQYTCDARNKAGFRRSSPAILTVLEVPQISRYPEDVSADEGATVEFHCDISSDSEFKFSWKKDGGAVNIKRWHQLADRTLRIDNVEVSDEGVYVCTAENDAGSVEAVARLSVEYTPTFLVRPRDQTVAVGRTVTLQCSAAGNPLPTIYWKTKTQETLLFINNENGRFSVADDGMLRIERVEKSDEGEYSCIAYSNKGEATAAATITVRADAFPFPENDFRPPPIIQFGPQNQTLLQEGVALLRCQANGNPHPVIRWYKHGRPLHMSDPRYTLLNSGTLQISSLKISDMGKYACKAMSETGETSMDSILLVEDAGVEPRDPVMIPDLKMLPGAPEKPVVSDVTDTSARLTWQQLRNTGSMPVSGYQVEYFAYGLSETWRVVGRHYAMEDVIVTGLQPNTTYVFLVRARNSFGLGGPSPLSTLIRTLEVGYRGQFVAPVISLPASEVARRLRNVRPKLVLGEAVNATAIRISWQIPDEYDVVDSFYVQYKRILNMEDIGNMKYGTVQTARAPYRPLTYTIGGLVSYEYYEICVMAGSGDQTSDCSSPMKIPSGESVPTGAPENVVIHREGDTHIYLEWSPPAKDTRKGKIIGYQIKCYSKDEKHNCSQATNGSTFRLQIDNLIAGMDYTVQMAAQTAQGVGAWSGDFAIAPENSDVTKEAWFIGMLIGTVGGTLWLVLCIFTIWLCHKRKRRKKLKEQWYTGGPRTSKPPERTGNGVRKDYGGKDTNYQGSNDSALPPEYNALLNGSQKGDHTDNGYNVARDCTMPEMRTFNHNSGPVTPYATTALLQAQAKNTQIQGPDKMFHPGGQGFHQHSGGSGDSNTDRSNTTVASIESCDPAQGSGQGSGGESGQAADEKGMLIKHNRGRPPNQAINWSNVLPPPPEMPPIDGDFREEDGLYSEIPEETGPMSPVSVCSCPPSHVHQIPGYNKPVYTDSCNRCRSLRNFENRPYSPQQFIPTRSQSPRPMILPPNIARTLGASYQHSNSHGASPVYLHGYSQPWDCNPLGTRGQYDYDYAQVPRDDAYNYTQPLDECVEFPGVHRGPHKQFSNPHMKSPHMAPGDYCDDGDKHPFRGPHRDNVVSSQTPGGPPGHYFEGPVRGQGEALGKYNRPGMDPGSQLPNFDGYKIESPPSSITAGDYRVLGVASSHSGGSGDTVTGRKSGIKGRSSSEGTDLTDRQYPPAVVGEGQEYRPPLYHSRSESSPPGRAMLDTDYPRATDSPVSEDPEYAVESETNGEHSNERDSMVANWESLEDCSSVHSSDDASSPDVDSQFLNEEDFADAVAKAAVMSGLTVVGTTVTDPSPQPVKRSRRHHRHARRPPSPGYSTDSNYGPTDMVHRPYPKSQRRRQMAEQGKQGSRGDSTNKGDNTNSPDTSSENLPKPEETESPNQPPFATNPSPRFSPYKVTAQDSPRGQGQDAQRRPGTANRGMFQFGEDIPVV